MNCSEAREMLSAYQELRKEQIDTTALEIHMSGCAGCRRFLDQNNLIGEGLRSLRQIEPAPDAYAHLMQRLATEHTQFLHRNPAFREAKPVPDFLIPYIKQQTQEAHPTHPLTTFANATTGPLPAIEAMRRRRRSQHFNQYGVLALAATFLLLITTGGLASLIVLTRHSPDRPIVSISSNVVQFSQIMQSHYTATTDFPHVVSSIADTNTIYYTGYNDEAQWMLEEMNTDTNMSTELLPNSSANPLIVLSYANNWLVWLQFDLPQLTVQNNQHKTVKNSGRQWSLHTLYLGDDTNAPQGIFSGESRTIVSDTFVPSKVPGWIHTPIQGIDLTSTTLLVSFIDNQGTTHLVQYPLAPKAGGKTSEIAQSKNGHILSSPTASNDNSAIYWSEEWQTSDEVLHSNVWTQQIQNSPRSYGNWEPHTEMKSYLFQDDGMSFHPIIVNDTLFILSTANPDDTNSTPTAVATATPSASPTEQPTANSTQPAIIPETDPLINEEQIDALVAGKLQAFSINGMPQVLSFDQNDLSLAPQGGSRFLLWQNSNHGFGMYDTVTHLPVTVGNTIDPKSNFLSVNNGTAVWVIEPSTDSSSQQTDAGTKVDFYLFHLSTQTKKGTTPVHS